MLSRDVAVVHRLRDQGERLHRRHAAADREREAAREARQRRLEHDLARDRDAQLEAVPRVAVLPWCGSSRETRTTAPTSATSRNGQLDTMKLEKPISNFVISRQLGLEALVDLGERRDHEEVDDDDRDRHRRDHE